MTVTRMDEATVIVKCTVCGTEVRPKRKGTCYTTQLFVGTVYWDYMDCPKCGCQILLNKRLMDDTALSLGTDNSDRCVCCGEIIPEGRMVCPACERRASE